MSKRPAFNPDQWKGVRPRHYVIQYHLVSLSGLGKRTLSFQKVMLFQWNHCGRQSSVIMLVLTGGSSLDGMAAVRLSSAFALLYTFVIDIVVVTVPFPNSLLFPATCSHLSLWCFPFVSAVLWGHPGVEEGRRGSQWTACGFGVLGGGQH